MTAHDDNQQTPGDGADHTPGEGGTPPPTSTGPGGGTTPDGGNPTEHGGRGTPLPTAEALQQAEHWRRLVDWLEARVLGDPEADHLLSELVQSPGLGWVLDQTATLLAGTAANHWRDDWAEVMRNGLWAVEMNVQMDDDAPNDTEHAGNDD